MNFRRSNFRLLDRSKLLATLVWRICSSLVINCDILVIPNDMRRKEKPPTQAFLGVRHAFLPHQPLRTFAMEARSLLASDWVGVVSNCTIGLD